MTAYTKVYNVDGTGQTLNRRTLAVYRQIAVVYKTLGGTGNVRLVQGSYTSSNSLSAGTHDGGGAFDLMPSVETNHNYDILQKAARFCCVAAWHRSPADGPWGDHVHGIVLGDKQMSSGAASQVRDYYAHRSGLVGHVADNTWHPSVIFWPVYPRRSVNLANVRTEAKKTRNWIPRVGVVRIQRALNKKLGAGLRVDGRFGPATKRAFAHWERVVGGNGDGVPGRFSLVLLGAGRFNVK
jgi:hypothetical protein